MSTTPQYLASLVEGCTGLADLLPIHGRVIKNGLAQNFILVAKMLVVCSISGCMQYAMAIFNQVRTPNVFLYNTTIRACCNSNNARLGILFYRRLCGDGICHDSYTFPFVLTACRKVLAVAEGRQVQGHIIKHGFGADVLTQTHLLKLLADCGDVHSARQVFEEMSMRDLVSWTTMVSAYASREGYTESAFRLFEEMPCKDQIAWNSMMVAFLQWGNLVAARRVFDLSPQGDVVGWTAIIRGYAKEGDYWESLNLYHMMRTRCVRPNHVTIVSALSASAHVGSLRDGMLIHQHIEKSGVFLDEYVGTTLVDMYSKCGSIESAAKVFGIMKRRDLYSWNTMIQGLAFHGRGTDALKLFNQMRANGLIPNEITFIAVLTACSHMGLVDLGQFYFTCMKNEYGIEPSIEHFGCLVDLLGRSGFLFEAEELAKRMPIEANAVVWGALLGACKLLGNLDVGERALRELLTLEPENSGNYVLLSNLYAETNRWDDVECVRKMMKDPRIERRSGCSSIELGGVLHEFVRGDKSHPLSRRIYETLDRLALQLDSCTSMDGCL
ncbi:pentatricopeptide repeat-containing protein At5g15300-like [Nymphaea colorata]|nr:pentatricopeptide repeat-containing protein At5g15300-like [Nymphaea colorata]